MKPIALIASFVIASTAVIRADAVEDSLRAAKDLYASAAYEDALSMLSRLTDASAAPHVGREVDQYRAFCLFALGRTGEAESIAESIIRRDPLTRLDSADASPRVETMFARVRQRLLPSLIREQLRTARAGIDEKNFSAAEPRLVEARRMLDEASALGVTDEGLNDVRMLVDGFLQLIRASTDQRAAGQVATVDGAPAPRESQAPPPGPASAVAAQPYSGYEAGVSPPVPITQRMPGVPATMIRVLSGKTGVLQVLIDEKGDVRDVIVRESVHPSFDRLIIDAARSWKYRPATKDGVPVSFLKTIGVNVP
jgi:TonB family protein